jgi:hypothetical protein
MLVLITINSEIVGQQIPFPFGVYVAVSEKGHPELETNYWQIKAMGANSIIQYLAHPDSNETSRDSVEMIGNIIAQNARSIKDLPIHYTTGYYNKWYAKEIVSKGIGLKKNYGNVTTVNGVGCLSTGMNASNKGQLWLKGPDYYQETKYFTIQPELMAQILTYNLRIRARKGEVLPDEEQIVSMESISDTLLKIEVTANYLLNNDEESFVLETFYIKDGDLSTEFELSPLHIGVYNYSSFLSSFDSVKIPYGQEIGGAFEWRSPEDTPPEVAYLRGLQFKIYWLGKRVVYIDYFDLYDDYIWAKYVDEPTLFVSDLLNYDAGYKDGVSTNLAYWNTRDEPYYLDTHEPYRVVDSILKAAGRTRLITPFITDYHGKVEMHWHGFEDADSGYARFTKKVRPYRFWSDHYPFGNDNEINVEFIYHHLRMFEVQYYTKRYAEAGFYYMAQTFGGEPGRYRYPTGKELWASIVIALAQGAKGIYLWKYYSNNDSYSGYYLGLVDQDYQPTELYNYIKDQVFPRLSGVFGQSLSKLNYNFEYHTFYKPQDSVTLLGERISFLHNISTNSDYLMTYLYRLYDSWGNNYLMVSNLPRHNPDSLISQRTFTIQLSRPSIDYNNWTLRDIEDTTYYSYADTLNLATDIPMYDSRLYSILPAIKYGGDLIINETLSSNTELTRMLTLYDTIFINTDKIYTINAPIDLQNGGFITGNGYIKSDSNFVITTNSWSRALLKGRVGNYPKLYWGSHPTISQIGSFKIYRKKDTPGFVHIATVMGGTRTYTDTTTTILEGASQSNENVAEYFIQGIYYNARYGNIPTTNTDTILYNRVAGEGLEKQGSQGVERITVYKLEQNYPNPFNPTTTITYQIKEKGFTTLKIYDLLGKLVTTLVNEEKENGKYSVEFNASRLSSGVYIYELSSGNFLACKKFIMIK